MRTYTEQPKACFSRALVYAKSSTSRWIASRSRKLSARSCLEGHCGPYALRVRAAAAEVFVVVVRFMGPLMGGLWVWEVVGVTQCCHRQMWQYVRGEGLATPSRHQSGHHLRVLRLQRNSISVNVFGPLLRLPRPFSASFQCCSLTSRGEG
jgi:hypothetical protein